MDEKTLFLKFWEREAPATRKVIAHVPQERCDYRPDPKARNARELAWFMVSEAVQLGDGLEKGVINWVDQPAPATMAEVLQAFDGRFEDATRRMRALPAAQWERQVPFMFDGKEVMKASGFESAWGFLFDLVHHRGQLSTYLRPMGSTVPSIYGPTADESM